MGVKSSRNMLWFERLPSRYGHKRVFWMLKTKTQYPEVLPCRTARVIPWWASPSVSASTLHPSSPERCPQDGHLTDTAYRLFPFAFFFSSILTWATRFSVASPLTRYASTFFSASLGRLV